MKLRPKKLTKQGSDVSLKNEKNSPSPAKAQSAKKEKEDVV